MTEALTTVLDGRWAGLKQSLRERMAATKPADPIGLDIETHRAQVLDQLRDLAEAGYSEVSDDVGGSVIAFQMLGYGDLSLMVKAGVQWGLFGGAVQMLGTERHHKKYLRDIVSLDLPGCFAMTETGHGSDVQHLRTTAAYDNGHFIVDTPDLSARKDYIGNAAQTGAPVSAPERKPSPG